MAVLYATGWEAGSFAWYSGSAVGWVFSQSGLSTNPSQQHRTAGGVGGNYSVGIGWGAAVQPGTVTAGTAKWLHFWGLPSSPGSNRFVVQFGRNTTCQINVGFEPSGAISIYRGSTLLGQTIGAWNAMLPHWFALEVVADNAGYVNVYVDGNLAATYSGDTQEDATLSGWDRFGFGSNISPYPYYFADMGSVYVDDIIVTDDATPLPEHYVAVLSPDGDTAQADFTPSSAGSHYDKVDEIPENTADYNTATLSGQEDRYTVSNPPSMDSILCVNICARATRDGALTQGEISVKSGSTVDYSTPETLPASPAYYSMQYLLETDPDTGLAWDNAGVAAMEIGFRVTT